LHLAQTGQSGKQHVTLETLAGIIDTEIIDVQKNLVRVNMGAAKQIAPLTVRVEEKKFEGMAVSMGNPHFVILVDNVESFPVEKWGPLLETHPAFAHKTNVEFVQVLDKNTVRMRVWERGAGITRACGTGSCATAVACITQGLTDSSITVKLDGGELHIAWPDKKEIFMTGPAQKVFEGEIEL
jgi:diaminopimelate epimerase